MKKWFIILVIGLGSIPSLYHLPFSHKPFEWGLDFFNLYAFQNCTFSTPVYQTDPNLCGDDRRMIYPPVLYRAYAWTKGLEFYTALKIWTGFTLLGLLLSPLLWVERGKRLAILAFSPLLLLTFTTHFHIERGNNDVVVLIFWSLAYWAHRNRKEKGAAFLAGAAAMLKVYPLAAFVLLVWSKSFPRTVVPKIKWVGWRPLILSVKNVFIDSRSLVLVFSLACIGFFLIDFNNSVDYFFKVLPKWNGEVGRLGLFSHSVQSLSRALMLPRGFLVLGLIYLSLQILKHIERSDVRWSLVLAVSSYFPGIAYDYRQVVFFPILTVLYAESLKSKNILSSEFVLLALGFIFVMGYRYIWWSPWGPLLGLNLIAQLVWFWTVADFYARENESFISKRLRKFQHVF